MRDLQVQRVGNRVEATWTTPQLTTEKTAVRPPLVAVLWQQGDTATATSRPPAANLPPGQTAPWTAVARQPVTPGPTRLSHALPSVLAQGPPRLLTYRLEILNANGRSAAPSNPAWTAAGMAPAPAGQIAATATPAGVLITWAALPGEATGQMELIRQTLGAPPRPLPRPPAIAGPLVPPGSIALPPAAPGQPPSPGPARPRNPGQPHRTAQAHHPAPSPEIRLAASPAGAPAAPDPGGLLDHSAESGATYRYSAGRVENTTLATHPLKIFGEPSPAVSITYRDLFPPHPPAALELVPEGEFSQAGQPSALAIDLSWEPPPETNLAGYNLYRSQSGGGLRRLNSAPILAPAYRDSSVQAGRRYRYQVTAVDRHGNESAPSAAAEEQLQP